MKAGQLGFLALGALLAGGLVCYLRAPSTHDANEPIVAAASPTASAAPAPSSIETPDSGDTGSTRTAAAKPAPAPPPAPPPAELQAPAKEDTESPAAEPTEDRSSLGDGSKVLPTPISIDETRGQYADLEVRYGKMSTSELRQSFDELTHMLAQNSDEKGNQFSIAQVDAIQRELSWVKQRLYP